MKQLFHRGDLVLLKPVYWDTKKGEMRHPACYAIINYSYYEEYGGGPDNRHTYSVLKLTDMGQPDHFMAWTDDCDIEYLVQPRCLEALDIIDIFSEVDH